MYLVMLVVFYLLFILGPLSSAFCPSNRIRKILCENMSSIDQAKTFGLSCIYVSKLHHVRHPGFMKLECKEPRTQSSETWAPISVHALGQVASLKNKIPSSLDGLQNKLINY